MNARWAAGRAPVVTIARHAGQRTGQIPLEGSRVTTKPAQSAVRAVDVPGQESRIKISARLEPHPNLTQILRVLEGAQRVLVSVSHIVPEAPLSTVAKVIQQLAGREG
jgi:hypothetical protein